MWPLQGIDRVFEGVEMATQMMEDARPLLSRAIELVDEVGAGFSTPLLTLTPVTYFPGLVMCEISAVKHMALKA